MKSKNEHLRGGGCSTHLITFSNYSQYTADRYTGLLVRVLFCVPYSSSANKGPRATCNNAFKEGEKAVQAKIALWFTAKMERTLK